LLIPAEPNIWDVSYGLITYELIQYNFIWNRNVGTPKKQRQNQFRTGIHNSLVYLICADNDNIESDDNDSEQFHTTLNKITKILYIYL